MIVVKKKVKKSLVISILAGSLAVLTLAVVLLNTLLLSKLGNDEPEDEPIEII